MLMESEGSTNIQRCDVVGESKLHVSSCLKVHSIHLDENDKWQQDLNNTISVMLNNMDMQLCRKSIKNMHENQKHKIQRVVAWWGWRWRGTKGDHRDSSVSVTYHCFNYGNTVVL